MANERDYRILNPKGLVIGLARARSEREALRKWNLRNPTHREAATEAYAPDAEPAEASDHTQD